MRRLTRWLIWGLGGAAALILVFVGLALLLVNTPPGRGALARSIAWATDGQVSISNVTGRLPDRFLIGHLTLRDARGEWLSADNISVVWSPSRLIAHRLAVDDLTIGAMALERLPEYPTSGGSSGGNSLHGLSVGRVEVSRLQLGAALAGAPIVLALHGRIEDLADQHGALSLVAERFDAPGRYAIAGHLDSAEVAGTLDIEEPEGGPLANLLRLPSLGALSVTANLAGPINHAVARLAATLGALSASLEGTLDLMAASADLNFAVRSGAMNPRPDLRWQGLALSGSARGTIAAASADARMELTGLSYSDYGARSVRATVSGQRGALAVTATASDLTAPGLTPRELSGPLELRADLRLDQPQHPVNFSLSHGLASAQGRITAAGPLSGQTTLTLRSLAPLARHAGLEADGRAELDATLASRGTAHRLSLSGNLALDSGPAQLRALLGPEAGLRAALTVDGSTFTLERAELSARSLTAAASGGARSGRLDLQFSANLPDLGALAPQINGQLKASGRLSGGKDSFALDAQASGELGVKSAARGPITVTLRSAGWPHQPLGTLEVGGELDEAPLVLAARMEPGSEGGLRATVTRGQWRSTRLTGSVSLPTGGHAASGEFQVRVGALADLDRLLNQNLSGSLDGSLSLVGARSRADVELAVHDGSVGSVRASALRLVGHMDHLDREAVVTAEVTGEELALPHAAGRAHLSARGPLRALGLRLDSRLSVYDTPLTLTAAASADVPHRQVLLSALDAHYRDRTAHLIRPAYLSLAETVAIDDLELSVGSARLSVAGQLSPALSVKGVIKNVTPALLAPFDGGIAAEGTAEAEFSFSGPTAAPTGSIRASISGLRMSQGSGRGLPAVTANFRADLDGRAAHVDAQANAGAALDASVKGSLALPVDGPVAVKLAAKADLALLNPVLEQNGRRLTGQLTAQATVGGSRAAPELSGALTIEHGELHDFANGIHLTELAAEFDGDGSLIRIVRFTARAGPGTVSLAGTIDLVHDGWPAELTANARGARALSSDLVTANADADIRLTGPLKEQFKIAGRVHVLRADITLPNRLPPTVAVLDVRRPGQTAAEPPPPPHDFAVDLTVDAQSAVFVRGRGVDAELGGSLQITGTRRDPQVAGGFDLRQGTFNLGGAPLRFSSGRVTFTGQGLAKRLDPSLDLVATSTAGGYTATVKIGGFVDAPTVTLSSTPELPPDQILGLLMFGQVSPQQLSALQVAQIGSALASISGVGGNGMDPLASVQHTLGLDRLSVMSTSTATTSTTTVEAGRYVSSRVYVGARQSTVGSTQAVVQIDVTKHLKVTTALGTGNDSAQGATPDNDPGNNIGISYQIEY